MDSMLPYSTIILGNCVRLASRGVYGNGLGEGYVESWNRSDMHLWGRMLCETIESGRAILPRCGRSSPAADNPTLTLTLWGALQKMVFARGTELKH